MKHTESDHSRQDPHPEFLGEKYFPFYYQRWFDSPHVRTMTDSQQLAYLYMCVESVRSNGRLNDDPITLLAAAHRRRFEDYETVIRPVVDACFQRADGYVWNDTALKVWERLNHKSIKAYEAVGRRRWRPVNKQGTNHPIEQGTDQQINLSRVEESNNKPPTPLRGFVEFYNALTNRRLSEGPLRKVIEPRLKEGVAMTTLKLAVVGACLKAFHLGKNDRGTEYLDPATILRPGRLDGHADFARTATWRIPDAEEVWSYWGERLGLKRSEVMEHFFRARDCLLEAEGNKPLGRAAMAISGEPTWQQVMA